MSSEKEIWFGCNPMCTPVLCPLHHFGGCEWRNAPEYIMEHCLSKHEKFVRRGYKQDYEIERFGTIKVVKDIPHVIEAHGTVFLLWVRKFPSDSIGFLLYSVECCIDTSRYNGWVILHNKNNLPVELICQPSSSHELGFDSSKQTLVKINEDEDTLYFSICIKDNALINLLSLI